MKLTGIKTKTEAVDFALRTAERLAEKTTLLNTRLEASDLENAVDPAYDLTSLRRKDTPW